jgi:hypothetical protein
MSAEFEAQIRLLREQIRVADVAFNGLHERLVKLQAERDALIEKLIVGASNACDDMEGANGDEFIESETRMGVCMNVLKLLGVKYDPITGQREEIK